MKSNPTPNLDFSPKFIVCNYTVYYIFNTTAWTDQLYSGRGFQAPSKF